MMRIRFIQSGGFAGLIRECEMSTDCLAPEEAQVVEGLVRASELPQTGEYILVTPDARDLQVYHLTLEGEGRQVRVVYDEKSAPAQTRPLLAYLAQRARPAKRAKTPAYPD